MFWVFYPFPRNRSSSGTGRSPRIITDTPSARMVWLCRLPLQSTEASEGIGRDQKEGLWRPSRGPGGKGGVPCDPGSPPGRAHTGCHISPFASGNGRAVMDETLIRVMRRLSVYRGGYLQN